MSIFGSCYGNNESGLTDKIRCPACGSDRVSRTETDSNYCDSHDDNPYEYKCVCGDVFTVWK